MKRILPFALLTPTATLAHSGGHDELSGATLLDHIATNPDHAALILAAAGFIAWRLWVRK